MVKYLLSTRKDAEKYRNKDFYKLLEAEYMTVLDKILEEGELKGIEKGIEKGKIETARNMRHEGIEVSVIVKVTGLTQEQLKENGIL
jgi:predicted transposase/invertase (TIGR01784 family)